MHEMMKVLLIDNLNLKTYLVDVSIGASNRNVGKISFQVQVVYQENLHHFNNIISINRTEQYTYEHI